MTALRTGVDLIELHRVAAALERHGDRFLARIYTPLELEQSGRRLASLAVRFAAKEATAKALGCGIGDVTWLEIEVRNDARRAPELHLHGAAHQRAQALAVQVWSLSLSHTEQYAIAFVVGLGG